MIKRIIYFLFFLVPLNSLAQSFNVDSLKKVATGTNADSTKINALKQLADFYTDANTDSVIYYGNILKDEAIKTNDKSAEAYALADIGLSFQNRGNMVQALSLNLNALDIFKAIKDSANIADTYVGLGVIYSNQNNRPLAYEYYNKAKLLSIKINDRKDLYLASLSLGNMFLNVGRLDSALYYSKQASNMEKTREIPYPFITGSASIDLANVYIKLKQFDKAGALLKEAIVSAHKNDKQHLYSIQLAYSDYLLTVGKPDSALIYANLVLDRLHQSHELFIADALYPLLAKIYGAKKQFEQAYTYQIESIKVKDSLLSASQVQQVANLTFNEKQRQVDLENAVKAYHNKLILYGALIALLVAIVILWILWKANKKQQQTNKLLRAQQDELKTAQNQLIQSAKMASLGELTAGIAHEIQNPLNFVNNFSEVNAEMMGELITELKDGNLEEAQFIADDILLNTDKIIHHGKRADAIVKGMLQHSRSSTGVRELTDINLLTDKFVNLAYQSFCLKHKNFTAGLVFSLAEGLPKLNIVPQDVGTVLLNIFNNAFYAMRQNQLKSATEYKPVLEVSTLQDNGSISIKIKDNGTGIPADIKDKIMQPFFTTKPTGEGTGLGLSLSYDIIKVHEGTITINTELGQYAEFTVSLKA